MWWSITCNYLSVMASSVASEWAFSSARITISKHCNCLDSDIIEVLQCLKSLLQQNLMLMVFLTVVLGVADEEMMLDIADKQPTNQEGSMSEAINVTFGLHSYADTSDCIVSFSSLPLIKAHVQYDLAPCSCTIRSRVLLGYDTISRLVHVRYQSRSHRYYDT